MILWRVAALLYVAVTVGAGAVVFPGELDHNEGDICRTSTGIEGICSPSCDNSLILSEPRRCGIKNSKFLFCCDPNLGGDPQDLTDISSPRVLLECGINTKKRFFPFGNSQGDILRPEAVSSPFVEETPLRTRNVPLAARNNTGTIGSQPGNIPLDAMEAIGAVNAEVNAWPWMALIGERDAFGNRWFCGGVLIDDHWVLTARHCFFNNRADVVRLGEHNYNDDNDGAAHEDYDVAATLPYPNADRNHSVAYHDLALLRLASRVTSKEHISPICLPWGKEIEKNLIGQQATLTGWGDTVFGGFPSSILQEVNVTVFSPAQCDNSYSNLPHYPSSWPQGIGQETLCAGDPAGGRDACQGDSGGPLVTQDVQGHFVLAGIVSRGYGCGHKDYPGLYVNLRHANHLAWIKKVAFARP